MLNRGFGVEKALSKPLDNRMLIRIQPTDSLPENHARRPAAAGIRSMLFKRNR